MIITVRASDDNVLSFIEPEKLTGEILNLVSSPEIIILL